MSHFNLLNGYIGNKAPYVSKLRALCDPTCTQYVEPYAGGAAVYFSHYNGKYKNEWINEINPNVALLYMALSEDDTRDATMEAILSLEKKDDKEIAKEQFMKAKGKLMNNVEQLWSLPKEEWPDKAKNIFHTYSQSFNCGAKSYSKQKSNNKYKKETKRNLINAVERLKTHPRITIMDGIEVIKEVKRKKEVQLFVDWPYVGLYREESKLYINEMSGLMAHITGAMELKDSKAAVVMCDYRSQYEGVPTIYDAIFTGDEWHCYKLADTYKHCEVVELGQQKKKAQEYVWTNRVPQNAELYLSMVDYKETLTMSEYWERIRLASVNRKVPEAHILEYATTYSKLYDGKSLFDESFLEVVIQDMKDKKN